MIDKTLNINLKDFKLELPYTYLYADHQTNFIYKRYNKGQIIGLTNFLTNRVVEVKKKRVFEDREMGLVSLNKEDLGWISLHNLIRLYRLPNVYGKFKSFDESRFNGTEFEEALSKLKNRIIQAQYYFTFDNRKFLMVKAVGKEESYPLPYENFKRMIRLDEDLFTEVSKGTPLFYGSNFNSVIGKVKETSKYRLIRFFEETNEVQINVGTKNYWIKNEAVLSRKPNTNEFEYDLDVIDILTHMVRENKMLKEQMNQQGRNIEKIKENLVVDDDFETLFLQKYLGGLNEY